MNAKTVKNLLKNYGFKPSKGLGQNFLINEKILKTIIKSANISKKDIVLEIGPGIGNLTSELAKKAKKIIALEKDERMCSVLNDTLKHNGIRNVVVFNKDILKIENELIKKLIKNSVYKVVANLPYYITSPVIRKFLETESKPKEMLLMVQKEVAKRICEKPPKMTILSVSVQFYAKPEIISFVSKNSFWPKPKVDSAVIKIIPFAGKKDFDNNLFFKMVKAGFSAPRKQLINNFSKKLNKNKEEIKNWLVKNNVSPNQRAESLKIEDWTKLSENFPNEN